MSDIDDGGGDRAARSVLDALGEGITLHDADGEIVDANRAAQEILRLEASELLSRSYRDPAWRITTLDGRPLAPDELPAARAIEDGLAVWNERIVVDRPDAAPVVLSVNAVPLRDETPERWRAVVSFRDVTERVRAEREAVEAEERWSTVFETVPVGIVISDAETGRLIEVNDAFAEMFGHGREEMLGATALELGQWDDPARRQALIEQVRAEGHVESAEAWYRDAAGHRGRMRLACQRLELAGEDRLLWAVEDITEERRRRERLDLLENAVRATDHGLVITDREGTIVWANPAFTEMTGYALDEAVGENPRILNSGEQAGAFYRELWETVLSGETWSGEIVNERKDGTRYVETQSIVPVRHRGEEITHFVAIKRDITERKRAEEVLRKTEERFRTLFAESRDPISITTPGGDFVAANDAFLELFGYEREELDSLDVRQLYADPEDRRRFLEVVRSKGAVSEFEADLRTRTGESRVCEITTTLVANPEGENEQLQTIIRDVTARKRLEGQLRQRALHDQLTGLPNRTLLSDRLEQGLARARRRDTDLGLLMLDVDRFKRINDQLGHVAGDRVLVELARRLQEVVRDEDTVARWGGDEFVVVLPGLEEPDTIEKIRDRIRETVRPAIEVAGESVSVDITIGAVVHGDGRVDRAIQVEDPEELIRFGDLALNAAKQRTPAGFQLFEPERGTEGTARIRRERELRDALETEQIVPHYQPIVRLADGALVGVEVLARWQHPERGLVPPDEFIPMAEELGLIVDLDEAVVRRGSREVASWGSAGGTEEPVPVNFNLSGQHFGHPRLAEQLEGWIRQAGLRPERVVLEVTETSLMRVPDVVRLLRERGFQVYVDDFGTGYSTFAYLRDLELDGLKIDLSFVQEIADDRSNAALVETMLTLGEELDLTVVAEGIETEAQLGKLRSLGCKRGQGFRFARPMPAEELAARWWERRPRGV